LPDDQEMSMESRHFRPGPLFGLVLLMLVFPLSTGAPKSRFEVSPALDSYLADDDWSAFEEQIDQLVKKRRLDPVRDSLRARFAAVVQPALLEKLLADYDNGLGLVLFDGSHYREALASFESAQRACSLYDNPEANQANLVNRTLCYALLGDTSASLSLFRQVIDPMIRDRTIYDLWGSGGLGRGVLRDRTDPAPGRFTDPDRYYPCRRVVLFARLCFVPER
jgi:tetratricopeptide (TPR) repeat protein